MLDLDPDRTPVPPKPASTAVVARDAGGALELFCVVRHRKSGFLGGALVFPGGKRDSGDRDERWPGRTNGLATRAASLARDAEEGLAFAVTGLRELLEEAALLPATVAVDDATVVELRAEWLRRSKGEDLAFLDFLAEKDLVLDTQCLEGFGRWVTPKAEARRYDTRFYLMRAPAGQSGAHDEEETVHSFWATPSGLLDRWARGEVFLAPPTSRTIELLDHAANVDEAMELARGQSLEPICPHFAKEGESVVLALPGDPLFPDAEAPLRGPAAHTRFVMEDGRFVGRRA